MGQMVSGPSQYQIAMLGLDGAGKSSILEVLRDNEPPGVSDGPTVGFNVEKFYGVKPNGKKHVCTYWDVGGQEMTRKLWMVYVKRTDGLILVVDATNEWRLDEMECELQDLFGQAPWKSSIIHCGFRSGNVPDGIPIVLFLNKIDLPNALATELILERLRLAKLHRPVEVIRCSAMTGEGLESFVDKFSSLIIESRKCNKKK